MPNFCKNSNALLLLISVLAASVILELIASAGFSVAAFSMRTIYLAWAVLSPAAILCLLKNNRYIGVNRWLPFFLCMLVFLFVEIITQIVVLGGFDIDRFIRLSIAAVLICLLVFRLFYLFSLYEKRSASKMEARMQSLQSKIEPHFLFNSLNSIAELTYIDAEKAEQSICSLSALLRNNLNDDEHLHTLEEEIALTKHYVQLEQLRLGDRLSIDWQLSPALAQDVLVPKLLLQPLVENAIQYGVVPNIEGGAITVIVSPGAKRTHISVENSLEVILQEQGGSGIALKNIRERLFVIYDDAHKFAIKESTKSYKVAITIPNTIDKHVKQVV